MVQGAETIWGQSLSPHRQRHSRRHIYNTEHITVYTREGLILSLDSNARSKLWFDKYTNARGRTMEEYIITRDLHIVNTDTSISSFETNRGRSWIDLTLCNSKLIQNIRRWACGEEESCADHKIICFDIESKVIEENAKHFFRKRYNKKSSKLEYIRAQLS